MVDAHDKRHPERDRALRTAVRAELGLAMKRLRQTDLLVKGWPERA
jgi:hypothetical protein